MLVIMSLGFLGGFNFTGLKVIELKLPLRVKSSAVNRKSVLYRMSIELLRRRQTVLSIGSVTVLQQRNSRKVFIQT